ncbi:hypothetical protein [Corynebacterium gerontici]|uniref:Uncharacterized protein n=1 Tax=Corynebacterium gerontici TaxID=2079234 RepID=A0A3G6J340_9CORY|nr:hypothetical protein [Corynebacterium gerontici]AZA12123.1 hypothetical protein CGERO_09160 [Corynebacterium gerontici]
MEMNLKGLAARLLNNLFAICAASLLFLAPGLVPESAALPPGGANNSNTGNSTSSVSPTTVQRCGSINYQLRNFAPNTMVSVKFDDGQLSSQDQSQQGAGVVARQMSDGSGSVSGTLNISCDFPTGTHWLRFLATERKGDSERETLGWSNRSPNFTVVDKNAGSANKVPAQRGSANANQGSGNKAPSRGNTQGSNNQQQRQAQTNGSKQSNQSGNGAAAPQAKNSVKLQRGGANSSGAASTSGSGASAGSQGSGDEGDVADGDSSLAVIEGDAGDADQAAAENVNAELSAAASGRKDRAPLMGFIIGMAVLIVGFSGIAAWFVVSEKRRRADAAQAQAFADLQNMDAQTDFTVQGTEREPTHPSTAMFEPQTYDPNADYGPPRGHDSRGR